MCVSAHWTPRLRWAIVLILRPSSSLNVSHLRNHLTHWNQTWYQCSLGGVLESVRFFGYWLVNSKCMPRPVMRFLTTEICHYDIVVMFSRWSCISSYCRWRKPRWTRPQFWNKILCENESKRFFSINNKHDWAQFVFELSWDGS